MSNRPRKKFLREIKKKLSERGLFKKGNVDLVYQFRCTNDEVRNQILGCLAIIILMAIAFIYCS